MVRLRTRLLTAVVCGLAPVIAWSTAAGAKPTARPYPWCTVWGSGVVVGTAGNDVICGSNGDDTLIGVAGNDVLVGFGGNDVLIGGRGWDRLYGGPGNDLLVDTTDSGVLNGGVGVDRCYGYGAASFQECETAHNVGVNLHGVNIVVRQP